MFSHHYFRVWTVVICLIVACNPWNVAGYHVLTEYPTCASRVSLSGVDVQPIPIANVAGDANPWYAVDNNLYTIWQPSVVNPSGIYAMTFYFDTAGSKSFFVTGIDIMLYDVINRRPSKVAFVNGSVGTSRALTDVFETFTPDGVYRDYEMWSGPNRPGHFILQTRTGEMFYTFQTPVITTALTLLFVSEDPAYAPMVSDLTLYGYPIIPLGAAIDLTAPYYPGATGNDYGVNSLVDGVGLSVYNPEYRIWAATPFNIQFQLNMDANRRFLITRILMKAVRDGYHYPTSVQIYSGLDQFYASTSLDVSWVQFNGIYDEFVLATPLTLYGQDSFVMIFRTDYWQVYLQQIVVVATSVDSPPALGVSTLTNGRCNGYWPDLRQFFRQFGAPAAVVSHILPLDPVSWDTMQQWWTHTTFNVYQVPRCFPYPYLLQATTSDYTEVLDKFRRADPSDPQNSLAWINVGGLDDNPAFSSQCSSCSYLVHQMYNELHTLQQQRTAVAQTLRSTLQLFFSSLLDSNTGYLFQIDQVWGIFRAANSQWTTDKIKFIEHELANLRKSSDPFTVISSLFKLLSSAVPGLASGVLKASSAGLALITSNGFLDSFTQISSGTPYSSAYVELHSPFNSLVDAEWGISDATSCTDLAAATCASFTVSSLSQTISNSLQSLNQKLEALTGSLLSNYAYFQMFRAWENAWKNNPVNPPSQWPLSMTDAFTQLARSTQASFAAMVAYRLWNQAFTLTVRRDYWGNPVFVTADPKDGFPIWESHTWDPLRSVFRTWNSTFFLSNLPRTSSTCPSLTWRCCGSSSCSSNRYSGLVDPLIGHTYNGVAQCNCESGDTHYYFPWTQADIDAMNAKVLPQMLIDTVSSVFLTPFGREQKTTTAPNGNAQICDAQLITR